MTAANTRPLGAPCHAHDACEVCEAPICTDCDIPDRCPTHDQEQAA